MNYSDGNEARLGDVIAISGSYRGVVVACIDSNEYSSEHPREQWCYLKNGIMASTDFGGLIHYADSSQEHITLVSRASSA